jgi:hypothetical protein
MVQAGQAQSALILHQAGNCSVGQGREGGDGAGAADGDPSIRCATQDERVFIVLEKSNHKNRFALNGFLLF